MCIEGNLKQLSTRFKRFLIAKAKEAADPKHTNLIVDTYTFEPKVHYHMADCYLELKKYDEALASIEQALKLDEGNSGFLITKAKVLAAMQCIEGANAVIEEIKQHPERIDEKGYLRLAFLQEHFPKLGDSQYTLQEGINRFPDSEELPNRRAYQLVESNPQEAKIFWEHVLKVNSYHIGARMGLARLAVRQRDLEGLKNQCRILVPMLKKPGLLKDLVRYCMESDLHEEAIDVLSSYLQIEPDDIGALSDVATCYAKIRTVRGCRAGLSACIGLATRQREGHWESSNCSAADGRENLIF